MNKKLATALSGAATLMLALSACGDSAGKVDAYAKTLCDQAHAPLQQVQAAGNAMTAATSGDARAADVKQADSAALQQDSDAYKALANAIDSAGTPPVKDGAALQQNAVKALNDLSGAYADVKKTVDGMNTDDQVGFANGLKQLADRLGTLSKTSDDALSKLQAGPIGAAMARQPGCRVSGASAAPSQAPVAPAGPAAPAKRPSAARSGSAKPSASPSGQAARPSSPAPSSPAPSSPASSPKQS